MCKPQCDDNAAEPRKRAARAALAGGDGLSGQRLAGGIRTAALMLAVTAAALSGCDSSLVRPGSYEDYIGPSLRAQAALQSSAQAATQPGVGAATQPAAVAPAQAGVSHIPAAGPLKLTVQEAVMLSLENNPSLAVERLNPSIGRTLEQDQLAAFDPNISATFTGGKSRTNKRIQDPAPGQGNAETKLDQAVGTVEISEFAPTGTTINLFGGTGYAWPSTFQDVMTSQAALSVTQAMLRGAGIDVNLASLRQARLDTIISQYELRGFAETLAAQVETAYWGYALAQEQIRIFTNSLNLAQQQLDETQERVNIGKLAPTEIAAAQAELALRREDLIDARSALVKIRLRLLQLISPGKADLWQRDVVSIDLPAEPNIRLDTVENHVALALRMRPDLNQARLAIQRNDLDLVRTKNGLLPQMDLFILLGKTGYADSFGNSVGNMFGRSYEALAGATFQIPALNRQARADYDRASITHQQVLESLANVEQLAQLDVRVAYEEVLRSREQISATAATRQYQEEKVRAESEKFRVGKSTSLLVAQAQRDLVGSQINEVQAVVAYLIALIDLQRLEGSLLIRRGIEAPGAQPVAPEAWREHGTKGKSAQGS